MDKSELRRMVKEEIRQQLNIILNAEAGENTTQTETINKLFPGQTGINARPVVHPFGFVSRAVQGIISVTVRVGDHIGNRMTIGHRDKDRPSDIDEGESVVYSMGKYQVRVLNKALQVGKDGVYETVVVGETLRDFLINFIQLYALHQHLDAIGYLTEIPTNAEQAIDLQTENLDNDKILAKDEGRF